MPNCRWWLSIDLVLRTQRFQEPQGFISIMEQTHSLKEDLATSWEGADGSQPRFCHVSAERDIINTSHSLADILPFAREVFKGWKGFSVFRMWEDLKLRWMNIVNYDADLIGSVFCDAAVGLSSKSSSATQLIVPPTSPSPFI